MASQSSTAVTAYSDIGEARLKKRRGIVVPQLWAHAQTLKMRPGQNAKVTKTDVAASKDLVEKGVTAIQKAERKALKAPAALGKHGGRILGIPHCSHQSRNVPRSVFSIRVHHHDCVAL